MWKRQAARRPPDQLFVFIIVLCSCLLLALYKTKFTSTPVDSVSPATSSIPVSRTEETNRINLDKPPLVKINNPFALNKRTLVLVLGMHHSMTSVATKLLVDTGLFFAGEIEELLIRKDNPMKYWELKKAVHADQAYFDAARDSSSIGAIQLYNWLGYGVDSNQPSRAREVLKDRASIILNDLVSRTPDEKATLIKDPRMSLTADVWLEAAATVPDVKPVCVVLIRDPVESVYRFLADYNTQRSVLSAKQWASVWEQYTFHALNSCFKNGVDVEIVRHEDYAKNPEGTSRSLASQLLKTDPSSIQEVPVPEKWAERHETKEAMWRINKIHLPLLEKDLLNESMLALWRLLQNATEKLDEIRRIVLEAKFPHWAPLSYKRTMAYVVEPDADTTALTLKVLKRSLQTFGSSRSLVLKSPSRHEDVILSAVKDGWTVIPCYNPDICAKQLVHYQNIVRLSGSNMVIGIEPNGDLILDQCPKNQCSNHQTMFDAFASIGGRVSEVHTGR